MATLTRAPTSDFATGGTIAYSSGSTGYTLVNDYPDTADPLTSYVTLGTTANSFIVFGFTAFDVPAGSVINSVQVQYTDEEPASGANSAAGRLRVGGTYYNAATHNPATTTTSRTDTWTTNPRTSAAWTVADVNGTGSNPLEYFGVIGPDSSPVWRLGSIRIVVDYDATQSLTQSSRFDNTNTFYAPTVAAGAITLTPALYSNTQTFYAAQVYSQFMTAQQDFGLVTATPDVYFEWGLVTETPATYTNDLGDLQAGGATQNLTATIYTNTNTFYAPTVAATYALTAARYNNEQTFYGPTVAATYVLTAARFDNTNTFYGPTAAASNTVTPDRYDNANAFYAPTVTTSVTLVAARFDNDNTFYGPTVAAGEVTLLPGLYENSNTFYSHVVTQDGGPQYLAPDLYVNTNAFYEPTVSAGAIELLPPLVANDNTFYAPEVTAVGAQAEFNYRLFSIRKMRR